MTKYEENAFRLLIKSFRKNDREYDNLTEDFVGGINCGYEDAGYDLENLVNFILNSEKYFQDNKK